MDGEKRTKKKKMTSTPRKNWVTAGHEETIINNYLMWYKEYLVGCESIKKTLLEEIRPEKYLNTFWWTSNSKVSKRILKYLIGEIQHKTKQPQDTMWRGDQDGFRFYNTSLGLLMEHLDSGRRQISTILYPAKLLLNLNNSGLFSCHKKKASHIYYRKQNHTIRLSKCPRNLKSTGPRLLKLNFFHCGFSLLNLIPGPCCDDENLFMILTVEKDSVSVLVKGILRSKNNRKEWISVYKIWDVSITLGFEGKMRQSLFTTD